MTNKKLVFSGKVPKCLMDFWQRTVGEQFICEIEFFAYIAVRWHLRHELRNRYGIVFIDREASRLAAIKRNSSSNAMFLLISIMS